MVRMTMRVNFCLVKMSNIFAKLASPALASIGIRTTVGLSVPGYPAALSAAPTSLAKLGSLAANSLSPILTLAMVPPGALTVVALTELRASSALATSQELVNFAVPVGLNWKEQSAGSAMIVTCVLSCAACSAGLAVAVISLNSGK